MAIYEGPVAGALRAGNFLQAAAMLRDRDIRDLKSAVLELEAFYYLGRCEFVREQALRLLGSPGLSAEHSAHCALIAASQCWDDGRDDESFSLLQRSIDFAVVARDSLAVCKATTRLLECTHDAVAFDRALPLAIQARRAATQCGDPHALVCVHVALGRLEARAGRFETSVRHFETARGLLGESSSLYWSACVNIGDSTLHGLIGDWGRALELAKTAARLADEAGWVKGIVGSRINAADLLIQSSRFGEAEVQLALARSQNYQVLNYALAIAGTQAQLAVRMGRFDAAEACLTEAEMHDRPGSAWYRASVQSARIELLLRQQRWEEALSRLDHHVQIARGGGVRAYEPSMILQRAEARLGLGQSLEPSDLPVTIENCAQPLPLLRSLWGVLAKAFDASDLPERASVYRSRARRLLPGKGPTITDHESLSAESCNVAGGSSDLEAAGWLFDLAAYPQALGREVFAILADGDCAESIALVTTGKEGTRLIERRRRDEHEVLAVSECPPDFESILVGEYGDSRVEVWARPRRELQYRCKFNALRKIIGAVTELDRYRRAEKQRAALWPVEAMDHDGDAIWASEQVSEVLKIARRIAPTPVSVLLTGETGTGKEMLAREIHRASDRAQRSFLPFNCAAVPRDMLESQLFGYRRGAFTGADASFPGVIRSAAGGTLFLDEIGDMPLDVQPKLLRFLETREIHPLGEPQPITVDVRIVAATNANLEQRVAEGRFREDLFYRLNVVPLKLPPLRERREEIPALVQHYLRRFGDEQKKGQLTLADETLEYLLLYSWPGNVRQLANEVRRMVAMAEPDSTLTPAQLSPELQASRRTIPASAPAPSAEPEIRLRLDQPLPVAVEMLEQTMIRSALERSRGRVEQAARMLGISRKGLFLKRRRWNLDDERAS